MSWQRNPGLTLGQLFPDPRLTPKRVITYLFKYMSQLLPSNRLQLCVAQKTEAEKKNPGPTLNQLTAQFSLGKPIDSYLFKMSCLSCLVFICVYCVFIKTMRLYKDICSAWISMYFCRIFFFIDWHHKCPKNTIDLLLFHGEYFYRFSENELPQKGL